MSSVKSHCGAQGYFAILCAVVIWGGSFAATKYALAELSPSAVLFLRFAFAVPMLALGCAADGGLRLPTRQEAVVLALISFQGIFFHQGIQAFGMKTAGAGNSNWMMMAAPALVALLGRIFLGEKLTRRAVTGIVLATAGVMTVLALGTVKETAEAGSFGSVGDYVMLLSVLNWAVFLILSRRFLRDDMTPAFAIFWELVFAFVFAGIWAAAVGADLSPVRHLSWQIWVSLIFLGSFSSGLAYLFWYGALAVMPVAELIVFQFLQPVAGMVISYFLIGERYTPWLGLGAALIMGGIWLVNKK